MQVKHKNVVWLLPSWKVGDLVFRICGSGENYCFILFFNVITDHCDASSFSPIDYNAVYPVESAVLYIQSHCVSHFSLVFTESPLFLGVLHDLLLHVQAFATADSVHVFERLIGRVGFLPEV